VDIFDLAPKFGAVNNQTPSSESPTAFLVRKAKGIFNELPTFERSTQIFIALFLDFSTIFHVFSGVSGVFWGW